MEKNKKVKVTEAKLRRKRIPIQNIVLRTLLATGGVSVALLAPSAVRLFKNISPAKRISGELRNRILQARYRLEKKGLVRKVPCKNFTVLRLTKKGESALQELYLKNYTIEHAVVWDGKWRMIMFDIPIKRNYVRYQLRNFLRSAGLYRLQDSVWIHPFAYDELVELLRAKLKLSSVYLAYMTVEGIYNDRHLKQHFGLE